MTISIDPSARLGDYGEQRILAELIAHRYRLVPFFGDDCAVLEDDRVITTDSCSQALVAQLKLEDPVHTGWLLATMNLSDLAAAGAVPEGMVVNYTFPRNTPVETLLRIMDGVDECASFHNTQVLGGDLGEGAALRLSATAVGRCPPRPTSQGPVRSRLGRCGAQPGDRLLLLGSPGYLWGAALLHHGYANAVPSPDRKRVYDRACRPEAQLVGGRLLAEQGLARAATDISDGLCVGVRNLCRANGLGARVSGMLLLDPVLMEICTQALVDPFELGQTWGDWCLLAAVAAADAASAERLLADSGVAVRDIGVLTAAAGAVLLDGATGGPVPWHGVEQERFSDRSWSGAGVEAALSLMRVRSMAMRT